MNLWTAIVLLTLIGAFFVIALVRYGVISQRDRQAKTLNPDNDRLQKQVAMLTERMQVLERIATENDRGVMLDREIERLRETPAN